MTVTAGPVGSDDPAWDAEDTGRPGDRTALAWVRTALFPAAVGASVLKFKGFQSVTGHEALGGAYLLLAVLVWAVGQLRFSTSRLHVSTEAARPWLFGSIAAATGLLAVATGLLLLF